MMSYFNIYPLITNRPSVDISVGGGAAVGRVL